MKAYPPNYTFGVPPGSVFQSNDSNGAFHVVNQGPHFLRVSVEVIREPEPDQLNPALLSNEPESEYSDDDN